MAAKAWGSQEKKAVEPVETVIFQNDAVSLCLLINRRARTMRVIDFRAGPSSAKRTFVMSLARREGVDKVYTLVERDEVSTWTKLGFAKEGNIPGFYKRSDAFVLGCVVDAARDASPKSHVRIALKRSPKDPKEHPRDARDARDARSAGEHPLALRPVDADDELDSEADVDAAHLAIAEKTLTAAKKLTKDLADKALPPTKVTRIDEADAKKALSAAMRSGRALTGFEPFGRDVERVFYTVTGRSGFELIASTEAQSCFGNALLELLTGPRSEAERLATIAGLGTLCKKLLTDGVVSCFALAPSDDVGLATAFLANGFRKTGVLQSHLVVGGERRDAIMWSRKLANPSDE
jgi:hypothetical protein